MSVFVFPGNAMAQFQTSRQFTTYICARLALYPIKMLPVDMTVGYST